MFIDFERSGVYRGQAMNLQERMVYFKQYLSNPGKVAKLTEFLNKGSPPPQKEFHAFLDTLGVPRKTDLSDKDYVWFTPAEIQIHLNRFYGANVVIALTDDHNAQPIGTGTTLTFYISPKSVNRTKWERYVTLPNMLLGHVYEMTFSKLPRHKANPDI